MKPEIGSGVYINYFSSKFEQGIPEALKKYMTSSSIQPRI
jgi:hypothetical protein